MKKTTFSIAIATLLISPVVQASDQIEDIIVSANNKVQSVQSITASAFVITQKDIEENQYQTLQQALTNVPGLHFYNNGGPFQGTSIQMRGSSSGQVLVMVDGIAINDPSGFGANLNALSLQDIKRIEVIKGPNAVAWGANAASGVIYITTKTAQLGEQGQVNIELGSNQTQKLAASLSAANPKGDFAFSASNVSSEGFSAVTPAKGDVGAGEKDGYSQMDFSLKIGINLDSKQRLESFIKNSTTSTDFDSGFPIDSNDSLSHSETDSELRKLQYRFQKNNLDLRAYFSQFEIERTLEQPIATAHYQGKIEELGAITHFDYLPEQTLTAGLTQAETRGQSEFFGVSKSRYKSTGLFVNHINRFNQGQLVFTQALRQDRFNNQFEDKVTGKVGLKNNFNQHVYLGAEYGTAYNAPSLFQYANPVAGQSLQPETTKGYQINLGVYGLEVSYYNNKVTDLLAYDNANFGYFNETGTSRLKGIETSYSHFFKSLDTALFVAYDRLTAKNSANQWLGRRPESSATLNLTYSGIENIKLGLETHYLGKMYDQNNQQGAQIGNGATTNLTANYAINKQFDIYARLINAFDKTLVSAVANYENDFVTAKDIYSNGGRQFYIGLRGRL